MNNSPELTKAEKIEKLSQLKQHLKKDFIGLDDVIDKLVESITSWYLYRDSFDLPYPVCIWGPTGTGKTKMAKKIVNFLGLNNSFIDSRDLLSEKYITLNRFFDSVIIDEFQNVGSKNSDGSFDRETKNNVKAIWSFLSEGDASISTSDILLQANILFSKSFLYFFDSVSDEMFEKDGKFKDKIVDVVDKMRQDFIHENQAILEINPKSIFFHPIKNVKDMSRFASVISRLSLNSVLDENSLSFEDLMANKHKDRVRDKLSSTRFDYAESELSVKKIDKCNPLVFILGNLDSVYSDFLNNYNSLDQIKDKLNKTSNNDVIVELEKLFFPEEISRLGRSQILFPILSKNEYKQILDIKMSSMIGKLEKDGVKVEISNPVKDFIYEELIDPRFGVRSVDSSFRSIFESTIISSILKMNISDNCDQVVVGLKDGRTLSFESPKSSVDVVIPKFNYQDDLHIPETQARIAIHEAGHALAYYLLNNHAPEYIRTKLPSAEIGGFVKIPEKSDSFKTKRDLTNDIKVLLAGLVSEKMFYNEDDVSDGAYSDLKKSTKIARSMIMNFGMGSYRAHFNMNEGALSIKSYQDVMDTEIIKLIDKAEIEISDLLLKNKESLVKLIDVLKTKTFVSGEEVLKIIGK